MDLEAFRREYLLGGLELQDLDGSPFQQFERWMQQAIDFQLPDPNAMVLATVNRDQEPSQRIVLLKKFDTAGLVFFTNLASAKAQDIEHNPKVSLLFPWHPLERQVRVVGRAHKVSVAESLQYFLSRPKDSQLAAWASAQSRPIDSRALLMAQFERMKAKFGSGQIPLPDFWGGYRVVPERYEFWQGRANRLHDRFEYRLSAEGDWSVSRLAP